MNTDVYESRLQELLHINSSERALSLTEYNEAIRLIHTAEISTDACLICKTAGAVENTGLCQSHALYALNTRK